MRRKALPRVWPKPRSKGSRITFAEVPLTASTLIACGVRNSFAVRVIYCYLKDYLEYNSTIKLSLISAGRSERSGAALNVPSNLE